MLLLSLPAAAAAPTLLLPCARPPPLPPRPPPPRPSAASAVATQIALAERDDVVIAYTDPGSEHPDNARFIDDCERWFVRPVVRLKSERYTDTWQVWTERRFLVSPAGALCTAELKRKLRFAFQRPDDEQVFGYTAEEAHRADRLRHGNPDVYLW